MNFKLFALLAFFLPLAISCQQNADTSEDPDSQESQTEQEAQAPEQSQPAPNARQSATEVKEVSDKELQQFMTAFQEMQTFSRQIQQEMVAAVQEQGLEAQRYSEIQQAQQNPEADSDITAEELEMFQSASQAVQKIQSEAQEQMEENISDAGLTQRRYQEISMMLQSDPQLQQKAQSMQQAQQ